MAETIQTPLTKLLGIKYPVLLAGMNGWSPLPTHPFELHPNNVPFLLILSELLSQLDCISHRELVGMLVVETSLPLCLPTVVAGPELAAAVSNCGGLGSIGGVG